MITGCRKRWHRLPTTGLAAGLLALLLAGCSPETRPSSAASPSPEGSKNLTCDDQASPATPPSRGLRTGDVIFDLLDKPIPQANAVTLAINGKTYYLYKAFLYVVGTPHSHTTITIQNPKSALLYYTDPNTWSTQRSPAGILRSATSQVTVEACPDLTGYTGGLLIQSPTCVRVLVSSEGRLNSKANLPLGVNAC